MVVKCALCRAWTHPTTHATASPTDLCALGCGNAGKRRRTDSRSTEPPRSLPSQAEPSRTAVVQSSLAKEVEDRNRSTTLRSLSVAATHAQRTAHRRRGSAAALSSARRRFAVRLGTLQTTSNNDASRTAPGRTNKNGLIIARAWSAPPQIHDRATNAGTFADVRVVDARACRPWHWAVRNARRQHVAAREGVLVRSWADGTPSKATKIYLSERA